MSTDIHARLANVDLDVVRETMEDALKEVIHTYMDAQSCTASGTPAYAWIDSKIVAVGRYLAIAPDDRAGMLATIDLAAIELRLATLFEEELVEVLWAEEVRSETAGVGPLGVPDLVTVVVTRHDVERGDIGPTMRTLSSFTVSPEQARQRQGTLDLRVDGYNGSAAELFEMDAVREFISKLDEEFPYWLYFANLNTTSLQMIALCHLPPYLTDEGKRDHFPRRLQDLMLRRWIPALNAVAAFAGCGEDELRRISDEALGYFSRSAPHVIG